MTQNSITLDIGGMTCASCVRRVERALSKVPGVETAAVNFASETAMVTLGAEVGVPALIAAVEKAGYKAEPARARAERASERAAESRRLLITLLIGAALAIPTIVIAMAMDIAGMPLFGNHKLTGYLLLGLATPVQVGLGWRFYKGAAISLRHLNPNMDVLVALGTTVAFVFSTWVVVSGSDEHMFFDVSAAVLVFITMGKYLEETSKGRASAALRALLGLAAKSASVVRDGKEVDVPVEQLMVGDEFIVRPGQRIAVDGVIIAGSSSIDESMVTGESIPAERVVNDHVIGGTVNQAGVVTVRATAVGSGTTLSQMARLVEEAQGSKAPIQKLVDQVAAVFVPVVVAIAIAVFVAWGLIAGDWMGGMVASVAVLVIACPCALGLATPTAIMVGSGIGAERGVLIRNAGVLEATRKLDVIVLDKTGTLTEGRPQVMEVVPLATMNEQALLTLAAAAESGSEHPLSRAVVDAAVESGYTLPGAKDFVATAGRGVAASVDGGQVLAGNLAMMADHRITLEGTARDEFDRLEGFGRTVVVVAVDGRAAGVIGIADAVKQNAPRAVAALKRLGLRVVMLTGDNERAASAVASSVGITEFRAGVRPGDKLTFVRELQAKGLRVAMAGDGVNDAPALAQADIGIAMSTGADVAIEAGDITLLHGDVSKIAESVALSRSTLATIRQNLVWAFGYNVVAIPVAAAGLLNPILAGAAMAFSSVSVMANSLRLRMKTRRIAEESGNAFSASGETMWSIGKAPILAMGAAILVLVVPLATFTAIDRDWIGGDDGDSHSNMGDLPPRTVLVELSNWAVEPSRGTISAGTVTFRAVHDAHDHADAHGNDKGGAEHDLAVLRKLPGGGLELVGKTGNLKPGQQEDLKLELPPGDYQLICDIGEVVSGQAVSHLEKGMTADFTVS